MELIFPAGQRYDCGSCTKCCRSDWNIHVDPHSFKQVADSPLARHLKEQHGGEEPMYMAEIMGEKTALCRMTDNGCVFLDGKLCGIHKAMGEKAKPLGCRQFPLALVPTPDGVYVGISFYCSAAQQNSGRPLSEHAPELQAMLAEYGELKVGFEPLLLDQGLRIEWPAYKEIEALLQQALHDNEPKKALWHAMVALFIAVLRLRGAGQAEPESEVIVPDAVFSAELSAARTAVVERDEIFEYLDLMFLTGVIGVVESANPDVCATNTEALALSGVVESDTFKKPVDLAHFDDFRKRFDASWSLAEFRRMLDMMLFRKFLAVRRSTLSNAGVFYLTLLLLEWFRDYSAYAQGKLEPDIEDVRRAFDVLEKGFTMHSRGMDPFFRELARTYSLQLQNIPGIVSA